MPQLDFASFSSQLFWLAVCFVILYVVLTKAALPGIREVLQSRQDRIAGDLDKADAAQKEAETLKASYTQTLEAARQKSVAAIALAAAAIQKEQAAKNAELDATLTQQMDEAEKSMATKRAEVSQQMAPVAVKLSHSIIESLLHKKIDTAQIEAAIKKVTL
jgi:F-type H+-transporting ATPase subunit b